MIETERAHEAEPAGGDGETEHAAAEGEQQRLHEHHAHEPLAAGAERRAYGELLAPRRNARQLQVGEIGARDEQHHEHDRLEHDDRLPQVADLQLAQRLRPPRESRDRYRLGRDTARRDVALDDRRKLGVQPFDGRAVAQPPDAGRELVAARGVAHLLAA